MRKILTVKELITILLDYNMDALVYTNANGVPTGISLPNVCYGGGGEGETKRIARKLFLTYRMKKGITTKNQIYDFRLYIDLANPEGDIGTETVWYGNKIIDTKKIKGHEKDS